MIDLIVTGRLELSDDRLEAWKKRKLTHGALVWPDGVPVFTGESGSGRAKVRDVLDAIDAYVAENPASPCFFELDGARISGFLPAQATALFHQDLATALRLASRDGGTGEVRFFLPTEKAMLLVPINQDADDEAPEFAPTQVAFSDEAVAAHFLEVMRYVQAKIAEPTRSRDDIMGAEKRFLLGEVDGAHRTLLDALARADRERLFAASEKIVTPRAEPLRSVYASPQALATALTKEEPLVRVLGIELLARVEPSDAIALADRLLADSSHFVREAATRALGAIDDDRAVTKLLALSSDPALGPYVAAALDESVAKNANTLLQAALASGGAIDPARWTIDGKPAEGAARTSLDHTAALILSAIGKRKIEAAIPQLLDLFTSHPSGAVRKEVARALALIGGKQVEKHEEALRNALMGMGRALNGDDARRRELLAITELDDGSILHFDGLTLDRFETLAREGFIHLEGAQNESPTAGQFLGLLREHPQITAHGYAVSPKRADYRVSIEGVAVTLTEVPEPARAAVRAIFEQMAEQCDNAELEDDRLYVWWD